MASQVAKSDAREGEPKESRNTVRDTEALTGEDFWSGLCGAPKAHCSKSTKGDWRKPKSRDEEESFARFAVMKRRRKRFWKELLFDFDEEGNRLNLKFSRKSKDSASEKNRVGKD